MGVKNAHKFVSTLSESGPLLNLLRSHSIETLMVDAGAWIHDFAQNPLPYLRIPLSLTTEALNKAVNDYLAEVGNFLADQYLEAAANLRDVLPPHIISIIVSDGGPTELMFESRPPDVPFPRRVCEEIIKELDSYSSGGGTAAPVKKTKFLTDKLKKAALEVVQYEKSLLCYSTLERRAAMGKATEPKPMVLVDDFFYPRPGPSSSPHNKPTGVFHQHKDGTSQSALFRLIPEIATVGATLSQDQESQLVDHRRQLLRLVNDPACCCRLVHAIGPFDAEHTLALITQQLDQASMEEDSAGNRGEKLDGVVQEDDAEGQSVPRVRRVTAANTAVLSADSINLFTHKKADCVIRCQTNPWSIPTQQCGLKADSDSSFQLFHIPTIIQGLKLNPFTWTLCAAFAGSRRAPGIHKYSLAKALKLVAPWKDQLRENDVQPFEPEMWLALDTAKSLVNTLDLQLIHLIEDQEELEYYNGSERIFTTVMALLMLNDKNMEIPMPERDPAEGSTCSDQVYYNVMAGGSIGDTREAYRMLINNKQRPLKFQARKMTLYPPKSDSDLLDVTLKTEYPLKKR